MNKLKSIFEYISWAILIPVVVISVFSLHTSCSTIHCKQGVHLATQAGLLVCEMAASEMTVEELGGKTPQEWCMIAENYAPHFEDYVNDHCDEIDAGI